MAKPALGRGLGQLLESHRGAAPLDGNPVEERPIGRLGLGVRTLLKAEAAPVDPVEETSLKTEAEDTVDQSGLAAAAAQQATVEGAVEGAVVASAVAAGGTWSETEAGATAKVDLGAGANSGETAGSTVGSTAGPTAGLTEPLAVGVVEESGAPGGIWALVVADVMLCVLAVALQVSAGGSGGGGRGLGWGGTMALSGMAVVVAGWLGCEAFLRWRRGNGGRAVAPRALAGRAGAGREGAVAVAVEGEPVRPTRPMFRSSVEGGLAARPRGTGRGGAGGARKAV